MLPLSLRHHRRCEKTVQMIFLLRRLNKYTLPSYPRIRNPLRPKDNDYRNDALVVFLFLYLSTGTKIVLYLPPTMTYDHYNILVTISFEPTQPSQCLQHQISMHSIE